MEYTVNKIQDQSLGFNITMQHNGKEINFNVVCGSNESEIPDLVAHHISFLEAPAPVYQNQPQATNLQTVVEQQQALIESLTVRLTTLENR
jgi:hypothetical protein